jgi:SAM-dependent methyltransferase
MDQVDFEQRYQEGNLPWDHGKADANLQRMVAAFGIVPCAVLDIGCGTGDNTRWFEQSGFVATGCDLSATAIQMAWKKGGGDKCTFLEADILSDPIPNGPFGLAFDRGCFHSIPGDEDKKRFVNRVISLLDPGGLWLSLAGNADEPAREMGPPQLTASQLIHFVEPAFELLSLQSGHFGSNQMNPPKAWIALMQKRTPAEHAIST